MTSEPLIRVQALSKTYLQHRPFSGQKFLVRALDGIDLAIHTGSSFALVGESGSGKSTLALCIARLEQPTVGKVWFDGVDLLSLSGRELMQARRQIQLVFQDTAAALNPRLSAEEIIIEPLRIQSIGTRAEQRERAVQLMEKVGLPALWLGRRPHQFSGGQRQRLAIARALALRPRLLILDEAFTGLDLSIQAQIVALLQNLQTTEKLTYLFISHDLSLMAHVADEIVIMRRGRIIEQGAPERLFSHPGQPETRALLDAIPGRRAALGFGQN
ncbi:MAG TPA: ATP-binding cassette domain-containing protein [Terriglobales bacterium]|nr:ATP-binding cassette domain-containing protein [Terriglobales bacterium]